MTLLPTWQLYRKALEVQEAKRAEEEKKKLGKWRAGNTGCYISEAEYVGGCQRLAMLRFTGDELKNIPNTRRLMFEMGLSNEDTWAAAFRDAGEVVKTEEDIPISWQALDKEVSGRPDVGILKGESVYRLYEMKSVSSLWTAKSVLLEGQPKTAHLAQAAHYFWQLGCPEGELLYTSRVDFAIGRNYTNFFAPILRKRDELQEYFDVQDGEVKKMFPFFVSYILEWTAEGKLCYTQQLMDGWTGEKVETEITRDGLKAFYETLTSAEAENRLPARPSKLNADGSPARYRDCDYCDLKPVCDKADKAKTAWDLQEWKMSAKKWADAAKAIPAIEEKHRIK